MSDAAPGPNIPSQNRNVMILLAYLWPLAFIPLLVEKNDREVQWHAKHGLVLFAAEILFWIVFQALLMILGTFLSCIAVIFAPVIVLAEIVLHLFAIIKGINGQRLIIPGLSDFANKL